MSVKPLRTDLSCPSTARKSMSASISTLRASMGTLNSAALAAIPEVRQPASAASTDSAEVGAASTPPRPAGASIVTKKRRVGGVAAFPRISCAPISTRALTPRCQVERSLTVRFPRTGFSRTFRSSSFMPSTSTSFSPSAMGVLLVQGCVHAVAEIGRGHRQGRGRLLSEQRGDEPRGPVGAVERHLRGVDRLAEVLEHRGAQGLRARAVVVEADAGAETIEAPRHVELLLEVVAEREVEERGAERGQLHGGGEPALDDREIGGRVVLEEVRHELAHLDPGPPGGFHLGEPRASDQ